jgi:phosphoribosyl-ATP pyrophosphohydrolase
MNDILKRAYDSNEAFYRAFALYPPQPRTAGRMLDEEAGELRDALAARDGDSAVLEECADVLYTLMGVLHARDYTLEDFALAVEAKCSQNDEKRTGNGWGLNHKNKVVKLS